MNFKISLAQMHIEPGKIEINLQKSLAMVEAAAALGSDLVLLPELWASGYDLENSIRHASASVPIWAELDRLAVTHQMAIAGSLLENRGTRIYNAMHWHSPAEQPSAAYDKIHLFRLMTEDRWLTGGDHLQEVAAGWGKTGLAICYDLRFPELFRRYALNSVHAVAVSAEWPIRRISHWSTLLRARAIENQMFVFATNNVGASGKDTFGGSSAVVSPWGEVLAEASGSAEELVTAEIDPGVVEQARSFMPVFQDRHPNLDHLP